MGTISDDRSEPEIDTMPNDLMPVGFIGHGSPLNVADEAKYGPWQAWGNSLPRPQAILAVSAHWEAAPVTIGRTTSHEELYYDFYGFPEWMYELQYPAPGAPRLAERVQGLLEPHVDVAGSDRPLDHGVWVPLTHMWPEADIPVLQISMPLTMSEADLYDLGAELSPLRAEGVLILGTGNVTHNLRTVTWQDTAPPDWVIAFDLWAEEALNRRDDDALIDWQNRAPAPLQSHPSAEHYRPLVVAAGAARGEEARFPVDGYEMGTIARRSVHFE
jgi:4,5-DOPA dioxygenase extradiol